MTRESDKIVATIFFAAVLIGLGFFLYPVIYRSLSTDPTIAMFKDENEIKSAASLFINDHCVRPISDDHREICHQSVSSYTEGKKYVCLSTLIDTNYTKVTYFDKKYKCNGFVTFDKNDNDTFYTNASVYLSCPGYMTDGIKDQKDDSGEYLIVRCEGALDLTTTGNYHSATDDKEDNSTKDKNKCPNITKNPINSYNGYILGDVNLDGELNSTDASLIETNKDNFNELQKVLADVNKDGSVSDTDAHQITDCLDGKSSIYNSYIYKNSSIMVCPKINKTVKNSYANYLLGDVNKDGKLNASDTKSIQSYINDEIEYDDIQKVLADVNKDGKVDIADILNIENCLDGSMSAYESYK